MLVSAARKAHNFRHGTPHLNHSNYTLAAIDDIIARGTLADWQAMRDAARSEPLVAGKIGRVCAAYAQDRYAQRHRFWALYVQRAAA